MLKKIRLWLYNRRLAKYQSKLASVIGETISLTTYLRLMSQKPSKPMSRQERMEAEAKAVAAQAALKEQYEARMRSEI